MSILLRVRHRQEAERQARVMAKIAREVVDDVDVGRSGALPGDPASLRGLPAVGVRGGRGGAIRGTRPGSGIR